MKRILIAFAVFAVAACHSETHVDRPTTTSAPVGPARTQAQPVWSPAPPTTNEQLPFTPR